MIPSCAIRAEVATDFTANLPSVKRRGEIVDLFAPELTEVMHTMGAEGLACKTTMV